MLLQADKISFGYDNPLFQNLSFSVNEGDRIGIVGENGIGKTSLLKCLLGEEKLNSGKIVIARRGKNIGYVPQTLPNCLKNECVYDYLLSALPEEERDYSSWKVDIALEDLQVPENMRHTTLNALSAGWQRMLLILHEVLKEPSFLLLDEPTNYLDLNKIFTLEQWLMNEVKIPYVAVSHDRKFLDHCTNKTIHIRPNHSVVHNLPYSQSREALLEEDLAAIKARELEQNEIDRIRAAAKRIHLWSAGRNPDMDRRAKAMYTRAEQLEAKQTEAYVAPQKTIQLRGEDLKPKTLLTVKNIQVTDPLGKPLFFIPQMEVKKGDRVAILAKNGVGKTQFLNLLINALHTPIESDKHTSCIRFNPQAKVGYFDQHMQTLPADSEIIDFLTTSDTPKQSAIKSLVKAGFPYSMHTMKIENLSEGEKARIFFLKLDSGHFNFFVMDEPTNHIDLKGQEQFEDSLISHENTCIFVSHDRYMLEDVANTYYQVINGVLKKVDNVSGFYDELRRSQQEPVRVSPKKLNLKISKGMKNEHHL